MKNYNDSGVHERRRMIFTMLLMAATILPSTVARGQENNEAAKIEFGAGKYTLEVPQAWRVTEPVSPIIEHEFTIPAAEPSEESVRITMMGAGGSVEDNLSRWKGQFFTDGGQPEAKISEKTIAGQTLHVIDVSGTFQDRRGMLGPVVARPDYRMLGAIIVTKDAGSYFVKFYGPRALVEMHAGSFDALLQSLTARK